MIVGNVSANECNVDEFYNQLFSDVWDYNKVIELATPCAEEPVSDAIAQTMVGEYFFFEDDGSFTTNKEKLKKAFTLFEKSADQGMDTSSYYLGVMYDDGIYVSRDILLAKEYYEDAAELDNAKAQFQLGIIYGDPGFIDKALGKLSLDYEKAVYWFKKSAENETPNATGAYNVSVMYNNGWGVEKNEYTSHVWLKLAAELGDPDGIIEWNTLVAGKALDCSASLNRKKSVIDNFMEEALLQSQLEKDLAEKRRQDKISKCELYVKIN